MQQILRELKEDSAAEAKARIEHEKAVDKRISDLQLAGDRRMDKIVALVEAKQQEQNKFNKKQHEHNKHQDLKTDKLAEGMAGLTAKFDDVLSSLNSFKEEAKQATSVASEANAATARLRDNVAAAAAAAPSGSGPSAARSSTEPRANQGIIKIGASRATTKQKVQDAFLPHILENTSLGADEIRFVGPAAGKNFEVAFLGAQDSAANYVNKLMQALRQGSGQNVQWKRFEIEDTGIDGNIKLYINRDKTQTEVSKEICTRKLFDAIKATHSNDELGTFTCDRGAGGVSINSSPLARVDVSDRSNPTLLWNNATVERFKVDKLAVNEKFLASASRSGAFASAAWSL